MMLSFYKSIVPSLIISEFCSVMSSHSVETNMSSSSIPSYITLLSNRYCHVLKGDIVAWTSCMSSEMKSRDPSVAHSISPSMLSSFKNSKFPYLITSVAHLDMPIQIYLSFPKYLSAAYSDISSQIYSSFPKNNSFNTSKVSHLIPLAAHLYIPSQLYCK